MTPTSPLGQFLLEARLAMGLARPGQLARLMRPDAAPDKIARLGTRIRDFELKGWGDRQLLNEIVAALGVTPELLAPVIAGEKLFRQQEEEERIRLWTAWADEPVRPYLVVRYMAAMYGHKEVPTELSLRDEMEAWASSIAKKTHYKTCLVLNNRISIYFNEDGSFSQVMVATPHDKRPNHPYVQIGNKRVLFGVGEASEVDG